MEQWSNGVMEKDKPGNPTPQYSNKPVGWKESRSRYRRALGILNPEPSLTFNIQLPTSNVQ